MAAGLPFEDRRDFEEARRGLVAPLPDGGRVLAGDGQPVWDLSRFDFIHEHAPAPETVNPSLWRQMQLTVQGGLYEVVRVCTRCARSTSRTSPSSRVRRA